MTPREKLLTVREPDAPVTEVEEEAAAGLVIVLQQKTPAISVTEDPEVDPEILGVYYRLRPDRAPKPRVTLNEIFASVKEGPMATPEPAPTSKGNAPQSARPIRDSGPSPVSRPTTPTRSSSRPRWLFPVLGLGATAALAMVVIGPMANNLAEQAAPASKEAFEAAPVAAPKATIPEAAPGIPDATTAGGGELADPNAPMPELASAAPLAGGDKQDERDQPAREKANEQANKRDVDSVDTKSANAKATTSKSEKKAGVVPAQGPATGAPGVSSGPAVSDDERSMLEALGYIEEEESAPAPVQASPTPVRTAAARTEQAEGAKPKQETKSKDRSDTSVRAAPDASPPPPPATTMAALQTDEQDTPVADAFAQESQGVVSEVAKDRPAESSSTGSPATSLVIWPMDYNSKWYQSYPDIASIYTQAQALESSGKWTEAAMLYRDLMKDGRTAVAQDAAYFCARAWWKGGSSSSALSTLEEGLKKSSANTPYRARLLALKGDILSSQGKTAEAQAAYNEAASLNAAR